MEKTKAIEVMKLAANKSQAINDMMHDFALRERARGQVTLRALYNRMKKAGFAHASSDYADGLKVMAECGFGEIRTNRRGNVVGLFGVKTKLASIGQAVVGKRKELNNYAPRNKYSPLGVSTNTQVKNEVIQILGGVEGLVRSILSDTTIPAERRTAAALALLEI